jgi:sigma-B regulation protein RsbQ
MQSYSLLNESILLRNNVRMGGQGSTPMVFAHGFGCDQNMWRFVAPAFEADHKTVLFDYVGSGKSDAAAFDPARYSRLDGYAQDLLEVCEALDLRNAVFVGHSVSAMIGLLAAIKQPERFSSLLMIGPSPRYINEPPHYVGGLEREDVEELLSLMAHNYIGWASHLAPLVMGNADRPELAQELNEQFCSTDPQIARVFANATFLADNRKDLPHSPVPSLIMQIKDDPIAPVAVGHYLHQAMPHSSLEIIEASGHCPHVSHPDEVITAMKRFLNARHGR